MLEFRSVKPEEYESVRLFLHEAGWQRRVKDHERFRQMMKETSRTVAAWDGSIVVGFARAVCDEVSNGYISMVAVAEDRRGQGIGRKLVEHLMGDDNNITWVLRAGRGSRGFWEKVGFKRSEVAMERVRAEPQTE
ncbi:MAG TPA: GNAT family N-acetyltransferase [Pyrinomonadaceae bacterium]|nr:GNAT family N-acetyltransferase [Pyrinomonadaceae bacterium]